MNLQDAMDSGGDGLLAASDAPFPCGLEDDTHNVLPGVAVVKLGEGVPRSLVELEEVHPVKDLPARSAEEDVCRRGEGRALDRARGFILGDSDGS